MNRKMKANAAKAERRSSSNGERKRCDNCGGKPAGRYIAVDPQTMEVVGSGSVCEPPDRKELH